MLQCGFAHEMAKWVIMGAKKLHKNGCLERKKDKIAWCRTYWSLVFQTLLNIFNSSSVILSKVWASFIKDRFGVNYCTIYIGQKFLFCFWGLRLWYSGWLKICCRVSLNLFFFNLQEIVILMIVFDVFLFLFLNI